MIINNIQNKYYPSLSAELKRESLLCGSLLLFGFVGVAVVGQWVMNCFKWDFG